MHVPFPVSLLCLCLLSCRGSSHHVDEFEHTASEEVVRFESGNVMLEGVLNLPAGKGKVPLAVFVHGSGKATRDDYIYISQRLNTEGYATFRFDKRGVGGSGGTFHEVGTWNSIERINLLASDAAAAIRHLRAHERIDSTIIVIGGSQAGWIIPVVCRMADVSRAICISGPTVSVGEEIYYSDLAENYQHTQEEANELLKEFPGPSGFDNIRYVGKMTMPSLWIFGGKDVSIPVQKCVARLDSVKVAAGIPVEMKVYPGANHGMFNEQLGRPEDCVSVIVEWLKR